ncbi:MAG: hypothetical protein AAF430_16550 [Myxococcota bacterium]
MPIRRPGLAHLCAVLMMLGAGSSAWAVPLAVTNPGFEDLYLAGNLPAQYMGDVPGGAFPTGGPPTGWDAFTPAGAPGLVGVLNPAQPPVATCFPAGAPEGDNVLLLYQSGGAGGNPYGVRQILVDELQPNTRYTLTVEVGNIASCAGLVSPYTGFFDLEGFPGYQVQLLAGGSLLEEDDNTLFAELLPAEGEFRTSQIVYESGDTVTPGQALEIRLISLNQATAAPGQDGVEVDFDQIVLEATPLLAVPSVHPAWLTAVLGVAGVAAQRRRSLRGRR